MLDIQYDKYEDIHLKFDNYKEENGKSVVMIHGKINEGLDLCLKKITMLEHEEAHIGNRLTELNIMINSMKESTLNNSQNLKLYLM